ncbi:glycosyltransferase [Candidatus Microgenomates bacterium]|nr:MAG: glycosyltransferase [Candidatus Microgenomates bacterium]
MKRTVTLAVVALNEAANIRAFLESVITQKQIGFVIEKIIVISDGSTDATVKIAQSMKHPLIEVWNFKNRIGKSARLTQLYASLKSDFLVQSDADVVFAHNEVVLEMIQPFTNPRVGMAGGNPTPLPAETFIESAINATVSPYMHFRANVRGGNNVFSADGRLLAYRKELIAATTIPKDMIANDVFTYFLCLSKKMRYVFVKKAVVFFRSPQTIADHIRQNTRFRAAPKRMQHYFPETLVNREFSVPLKTYVRELFASFLRHPFQAVVIYMINRYCIIKARRIEQKLNAKWQMANSTKRLTLKLS